MRLIDADALDISGADFKNYDDYSHYIDLITNAPTVEERKHGHWDYSNIAKQGYKCSVCNRSSKNCSPFCQWCGAIMDDESE